MTIIKNNCSTKFLFNFPYRKHRKKYIDTYYELRTYGDFDFRHQGLISYSIGLERGHKLNWNIEEYVIPARAKAPLPLCPLLSLIIFDRPPISISRNPSSSIVRECTYGICGARKTSFLPSIYLLLSYESLRSIWSSIHVPLVPRQTVGALNERIYSR